MTGEEVFPNLVELRRLGANILACPSCGQMHRWLALESKLVEIVQPDRNDPEKSDESS